MDKHQTHSLNKKIEDMDYFELISLDRGFFRAERKHLVGVHGCKAKIEVGLDSLKMLDRGTVQLHVIVTADNETIYYCAAVVDKSGTKLVLKAGVVQ